MIPSSQYGSFENTEIMRRQMGPVAKNAAFMVEEDFLDRANVDIMKGKVIRIDVEAKEITLSGMKKPIKFDKAMIAWGAEKMKLNKAYSNVYYIEDRFSHAKIHNALLRSKKVVVMGNGLNAI